jgi:hypothetical protein
MAPPKTPKPDNEAFLSWLASIADPAERFRIATEAMRDTQETERRLRAIRSAAIGESYGSAGSLQEVAERYGVTRQRAHQILHENRPAEAAAGGDPQAGRRGRRRAPKKKDG